MDSEGDYAEADQKIALALGVTLGTLAEKTSAELSRLYVRLRVGGGMFSGKPMTQDLVKANITLSCSVDCDLSRELAAQNDCA